MKKNIACDLRALFGTNEQQVREVLEKHKTGCDAVSILQLTLKLAKELAELEV